MELKDRDFFVRIQDYEAIEKSNITNNTWGSWRAYDYEEINDTFCIVSGDNSDPRKLFVVTYDFTKSHNDDEENLIEEKKEIMQKLLQLKKKTAYFCQADYGSVQEIADGDVLLGYDALVRYIPLPSLTEYRKNHVLSSEEEINKSAKQMALHIASAMNKMHKLDLIYGSIQPDNICVDDKSSKETKYILSIPMADWFLGDNKKVKSLNNYLAPELLKNSGSPFSVQSDIYSLGITIYQALNDGKIPFETAEISASAAFKKRCKGDEEIPCPAHGTAPMQYIVRKAIANDTKIRYGNIRELIDDLEKIDGFISENDVFNNPMVICTVSAEAVRLRIKKEKERIEQERKEKEEKQRIEREKREQEEKERLEQIRNEKKREKERQRIEQEKREREERERQQRIEQEKREQEERERQEINQGTTSTSQSVLETDMSSNNGNTSQPEPEHTGNNKESNDTGTLPPETPKKGCCLPHILVLAAVVVGIIFVISKCMGKPSSDDVDVSSSQQSRTAESSTVDESSESETENTDDDLTAASTEQSEETTAPATTISPMTVVTSEAVKTDVKTAIPVNTTKPQQSVENVRMYEFVSGKYTWEEAKAYCESHGGQLATVHSDEDWNALISVVDNARNKNSDLQYIWLGATSTLNLDNMTISFKWVDNSDTSYIIGDTFKHWYYNSKIGMTEPSGYDAYEYTVSGNIVREPYLMLWYVAPETGAKGKEWSLNDICDVSGYSNYKDSNMGFVMEKVVTSSSDNNNNSNNSANNNSSSDIKPLNATGTVVTEKDPLNVRISPSTDVSTLGTVQKGATVKIVGQTGDWYKIEYNGGHGYVLASFISVSSNNSSSSDTKTLNATGTVVTEKDPLNVRSSPSTDASKLGTVPKGSTVNIVEQTGDWYKIEFNNGYGYVSSEFISVKKKLTDFRNSIASIEASSQLKDETVNGVTHSYSPSKLIDDDVTTCWVEGKDDYGIGEKVVIKFDNVYSISKINIWNGLCNNENNLFYKNSRVKDIKITFSDGIYTECQLKDGFESCNNAITFGKEIETSSVTIEILSVYEGEKYKDTCISEISVS